MAKRRRGRKKIKNTLGIRLKPKTVKSVFFIFFLLLTIISIFSFLQSTPSLIMINKSLISYFGLVSLMLPFLFLLLAFSFIKVKTPLKEPSVFFGFLIVFISILALTKQGLFGKFLWEQVSFLFTQFPAFLIFLATLVVGFVVLFDTSIAQIIKNVGEILFLIKKYTLGQTKKTKSKKSKTGETVYIQEEPKEEKKTTEENVPVSTKPVELINPASSKPLSSSSNQIWEYPSIDVFDDNPGKKADRGDVRKNAEIIEQTLDSFGITARVAEVNNSPSVTQYALQVALGTKLAKIVNLGNDLAMALAAPGGQIRIEAPIPGRSLVGIEVPNRSLQIVPVRKILEDDEIKNAKSKIIVPLGLSVSGKVQFADIAQMPHVLIAGQTGSGKSICINSWISTLLFRASPDELRLIMVDPKRVELTPYNGIPHLLTPVIVDPDKVVSALKWAVTEMENRYKVFAEVGAKNISSYNDMAGFQSLPYVLIIIDELADIMLFSPAEVEDCICRIAQMARAVGIHLILATQRPSVDILTGLIKANIPTRVAFAVSSMTDSRVILDTPGAEKLLGRGDMLYIPPELAKPLRIQGCFVSDKEIKKLIDHLQSQKNVDYDDQIINQPISAGSSSKNLVSVSGEEKDVKFDDAIAIIKSSGKASASLLQRQLKLGYARAARILDQLEVAGIVGPVNGSKPREIFASKLSDQ
ncbi:DNA translocase FtsK [Patescibacteria group bacterium]|nr:DNA translocase FtsK [Patescibacteria group bacterium]MCG2701556.1 DNA translocase FtsK [Candidatus Parcubacteria bacterium]MBU4210286.1 DNA translocase FtsK [Patescibacteria group bacterium]MBU4264476.1 DNA translocase FtsK [Patescibacteria group bacterium]MBU4390407.1 DNA translocase FtsK [Patescibacteria group bacterium]